MSLTSKLEAVEERFRRLDQELTRPEVVSDPNQVRELARERSQLEPTVELFREYRTKRNSLDEAREILDGGDEELAGLARDEVEALEPEIERLEHELRLALLPTDPLDDKNIMIEIRAGTGGDEASLFAGNLFRMYTRYAELRGWKHETLALSETDVGGVREVILSIRGNAVYSVMKHESGVHRVQRVPTTESSGRIHTSTATVAVLPEADEVDLEIDENDIRVDTFCSSGPGGQSVNTTKSAIRLTHEPTGLVVQCQDEKSQHKNKAKAMKVLRARLLALEVEKAHAERSADRRGQVGSGDRSERIRTYNFPQSRVSDHRIHFTVHNLSEVLEGSLDEIMTALRHAEQEAALQALAG